MAEEETLELEISEDDIVRYLTNDKGEEIGIVVMEGGKEVEYLYAGDDEEATSAENSSSVQDCTPGHTPPQAKDGNASETDDENDEISYKKVQGATDDMNAIFKDGVKVASEFKGAYDDIKEALNFKDLLDVKSWLK